MKKQLTPEQQEEKRLKRKAKKEADSKKETVILDESDQTFIDKYGDRVILTDFLKPDEYWEKEDRRNEDKKVIVTKKKIITYDGAKRLAKGGGITYFTKVVTQLPTIENKDSYGFDVTAYCSAGIEKEFTETGSHFCLHGYFKTTVAGHANEENTKGMNKKYKALAAERRGQIRAILNHLGLVKVLGEDELSEETSEESTDDKKKYLSPADYEELQTTLHEELSKILNCTDKDAVELLGQEFKEDSANYTKPQLDYLRIVWTNKLKSFDETKF